MKPLINREDIGSNVSILDVPEQDFNHLVGYCPQNMEQQQFITVLRSLYIKGSEQPIDLKNLIAYTNEDGLGVFTEEAKQKIYEFINNFPEGEDKKWVANNIGILITEVRNGDIGDNMTLRELINPEYEKYRMRQAAKTIDKRIYRIVDRGEDGKMSNAVKDVLEEPKKIDIFIKTPQLGD